MKDLQGRMILAPTPRERERWYAMPLLSHGLTAAATTEAVREYLRTPELKLQLVNLPGYSPDFNADEAIRGWAREEATGNLSLGSR